MIRNLLRSEEAGPPLLRFIHYLSRPHFQIAAARQRAATLVPTHLRPTSTGRVSTRVGGVGEVGGVGQSMLFESFES